MKKLGKVLQDMRQVQVKNQKLLALARDTASSTEVTQVFKGAVEKLASSNEALKLKEAICKCRE
eukprot:2177936-Amphidinium_carterae.1